MIALGNEVEKKTVSCLPVKQLTKKVLCRARLLVAYLFMMLSASLLVALPFHLFAKNNVVTPPIILASSSALSGPAGKLGTRLNQGAQAYFDKINKVGGIAGRPVYLKSLDDGYEPFKTLKNTQLFLNDNSIFALFNYVGTPTAAVVFPFIENKPLPFLMPFTGANFLREPVTENIFNLRASYYQEVDAQIKYLVKEQKITKIGLLIQADAFGVTVEKGYINIMKKYGTEPVVTTRYRRNTEDVALALSVLKDKNVEAIAFVGTYEPLAELINIAAAQEFTPFFTAVSFISSHDLFPKIMQKSRVLVTEVMPEPQSCTLNICNEFINDMKEIGIVHTDQVQLEGYLNAYLFTEVAKQCAESLNQTCFLNSIKNFSVDFGGITASFAPNDHQGLDNIYLNFFELKK